MTRDDAVHDCLSPDDETALPVVRLVVPAVSVLVPLVTLTLSYVRGTAREAPAIVATMKGDLCLVPHHAQSRPIIAIHSHRRATSVALRMYLASSLPAGWGFSKTASTRRRHSCGQRRVAVLQKGPGEQNQPQRGLGCGGLQEVLLLLLLAWAGVGCRSQTLLMMVFRVEVQRTAVWPVGAARPGTWTSLIGSPRHERRHLPQSVRPLRAAMEQSELTTGSTDDSPCSSLPVCSNHVRQMPKLSDGVQQRRRMSRGRPHEEISIVWSKQKRQGGQGGQHRWTQ